MLQELVLTAETDGMYSTNSVATELTAARTIDPPPVLQLLINDFDPEVDSHYLEAHDWVVFASLVSVDEPYHDITQQSQPNEMEEDRSVMRQLLGNNAVSGFPCQSDPHPETAPSHPVTRNTGPSSPTSRFISRSSHRSNVSSLRGPPGLFFIFPDMSVRKAGQYRMCFKLMKMNMEPGQTSLPTISTIISDVFNVVNAKDFDQVQPSTQLVRGLVERGAGYPLKLKKGFREGQKRRAEHDSDNAEDWDHVGNDGIE